MNQLTVIGIGNRLRGDDAVGPLLIDKLSSQTNPGLELIDAGSDALGLLEYLEGHDKMIIVDACKMGKQPGELVCFDPTQASMILVDEPLSLHGLGLAEALRMAESLHMLPEDLKIIGIEPYSIQFNGELSAPVQQALKSAIDKVHEEFHRVTELIEA